MKKVLSILLLLSLVISQVATASTISLGTQFATKINPDGTVSAWGDNLFKQSAVPKGLSNVIAVAAGHDHAIALTSDGKVVGWGEDYSNVPEYIAAECDKLKSNPYCFALDNAIVSGIYKLIGNKKIIKHKSTIPKALNNVVSITAGGLHSVALKSDGTVQTWGLEPITPIEKLAGTSVSNKPPKGLNNVVAVSAGYNHTLALKKDGTVVGWGRNKEGQISIPGKLNTAVSVSAYDNGSAILKKDGNIVYLGKVNGGLVSKVAGGVDIAYGGSIVIVLKSNGEAIVSESGKTPRTFTEVKEVSASNGHGLILKKDNSVVAIGKKPPTIPKRLLDPITDLYVNGVLLDVPFSAMPTTVSGNTMVPVKEVMAKLGASISAKSSGVSVVFGDKTLTFKPGSKSATLNGKSITLPAPVTSLGGKLFVPLRSLPELTGASYKFVPSKLSSSKVNEIYITSN